MADEFGDQVQPEDGQGQETVDAPYAEYLTRIPEEVRGQVEPVFRDWDKNVTQRFQEASEYKQSWEPYEQAGVNQYDPEAVQWALNFFEAQHNNPQAVQEWYQQYAQERGLSVQEQQQWAEQAWTPDEYGLGQDPAQIQQLLEQQLSPIQQQLQQMNAWREQQEQSQRQNEAIQFIEGQIGELEQKHGGEFNRNAVERLVAQYIETDPRNAVQRASSDYQSLVNQIQKDTLQGKLNQPPPAEGGGSLNSIPEAPKTMQEANDQARNILKSVRMA